MSLYFFVLRSWEGWTVSVNFREIVGNSVKGEFKRQGGLRTSGACSQELPNFGGNTVLKEGEIHRCRGS